MPGTSDLIDRIGTEIIRCDEKCEGVICDQVKGYYPRVFFLYPNNSCEVNVVIVGKNPGSSPPLEREFYKALAEHRQDKIATYKDCLRVWNACTQIEYFQRPLHLLKELGLPQTGILWAEVVFCESKSKRIPRAVLNRCRERFLGRILNIEILAKGKHVLCLGKVALENVRELTDKMKMWKIVGVYHPTGTRTFANYFDGKGEGKLTLRKHEG